MRKRSLADIARNWSSASGWRRIARQGVRGQVSTDNITPCAFGRQGSRLGTACWKPLTDSCLPTGYVWGQAGYVRGQVSTSGAPVKRASTRAKVPPVQLDGSAPKTVPTASPRGGVGSRHGVEPAGRNEHMKHINGLFRDFRVKWDKGFGAGGRRGIFLLQKAVTFSFAGFLEKEDAVVGVGMMV